MNKIKNFLAIGAFSLLVLGIPAVASAQYGGSYDPYGRNGQYDPYGRNGQYGTYNRNGQYGDMRSVVRDLKNRSRDFERQLDRDLDNSRYNGSRREDEINQLARDFRNAVNRINDNGNGRNEQNDVQRALNIGSQIDRVIGRRGLSYASQNLWQGIRYDLNTLASMYGGYNNRGNRNGGYNNGGWNNGNRPSWWPF